MSSFRHGHSTGSCGSYATIDTSGSAITSYTATGLGSGDAYCFEVEATNTYGTSAASSALADAPTISAAPSSLAVGTVTTTTVSLTWTAPTTSPSSGVIASYTVLQAAYSGSCGSYSTSYTGASEPYTVTGLTSGSSYCFEVEAVDSGGSSAASSALTDIVTITSAPTALAQSTTTTTSISLTWTAPTTSPSSGVISSYTVLQATHSGSCSSYSTTYTGASEPYAVTGLTAGNAYCFEVEAIDSGGTSAASTALTDVATVSSAPTSLTASSVTTSTIPLSWTNPSGTLTGDIVLQATDTGSCGSYSSIYSPGSVFTTYTVTGLTSGDEYCYEVEATTSGGSSAPSIAVTIATITAAPTSPSESTATLTSISLTWFAPATSPSSGVIISYTVLQAAYSGSCGSYSTSYTGVSEPYTVTGLTSGNAYCFEVEAVDSGGTSAASSALTDAMTGAVPAAPTGLSEVSGSPTTTTAIGLTWTNPTGTLTGDVVLQASYSTGSCGSYTTIDTSGSAITSYTATGLTSGDAYCFEVEATNTYGTSAASSALADAPTITAAPTSLAVGTVTTTTVPLTWTAPTTSPSSGVIASYTVLQAAYSGSCGSYSTSYTGASEPYTVTGLTSGSSYCFEVEAVDSGGSSAASSALTDIVTITSAPTALAQSTTTTTSISLTWTAPTTSPSSGVISSYTVLQATYSGSCSSYSTTYTGASEPYAVTGLTAGNAYCFEVEAIDSGGTSAASTALTDVATVSSAPTSLTASSVTTSTIPLSWTNPSGTLTGDIVLQATDTGSCGSYSSIYSPGSVFTTYTVTGLTSGDEYCYEVEATTSGGSSAPSIAVTIATITAAPTSPSESTATLTSISLTWFAPATSPSSGVIISYTVLQAAYSGSCGSYSTSYTGVSEPYTVTGLTSGNAYCFEVEAVDSGGTSAASSALTDAMTGAVPAAPTGLSEVSGSPTTTTAIGLTWTNPTGTLTGDVVLQASYSTGSCGSYTTIDTSGSAITSYTATGLGSGDAYCFEVEATNTYGTSAASSALADAPTITAAPTSLAVGTVTTTTVPLTWTAPTTSPSSGVIASYTVLQAAYSGSCGSYSTSYTGASEPYTVTGLTSGSSYCFEVEAVDSGGSSAASSALTDIVTITSAPTALAQSTTTTTSISLTWTAPTTSPSSGVISSYTVLQATYSGSCSSYSTTYTGASEPYAVTGLTAGNAYCFEVEAIDSGGTSAASTALTDVATVSSAPTSLTASSVTTSTIPLSWTNPSGTLTGDIVLQATDTGSCGSYSSIYSPGSVFTTYTVTGLTSGDEYCYEVEATTSGGSSAPSIAVTIATITAAPTSPSESTATLTSISLTWFAPATSPSSGVIISYTVLQAAYSGSCGSYSTTIPTGLSSPSYTVTGLTSGSAYCFEVEAVDSGGPAPHPPRSVMR